MAGTYDAVCSRWTFLALAVCLVMACDGDVPSRDVPMVDLNGAWDGQFNGIVQGTGASQTDTFVMELSQSGATVTDALLYQGTETPLPLSGTLTGNAFAFRAAATIAGCQVRVDAETTIDPSATRLSGSQTQSTCEGTAVGQMSATRR